SYEDADGEDEDMDEDYEAADHSMADVTMASNAGIFGRASRGAAGADMFRGSSRSPLKRHRAQEDIDIVSLRQDFAGVAKGMAAAEGMAELLESDELILETDGVTTQLGHIEPGDEEQVIAETARELCEIWEGTD